jgi:hypothetical protein
VYALGALLVRCVTGAPPFPEPFRPAALAAHLATPPPRPSERVDGLPEALDDVVLAALAKDPSQRPASAGELITRAARARSGEPGSTDAAPDSRPAVTQADAGRPPSLDVPTTTTTVRLTGARTVAARRLRAARGIRGLVVLAAATALAGLGVLTAVRLGGDDEPAGRVPSATKATRGLTGTVVGASLGPPDAPAGALGPSGAVRVVSRAGRQVLTVVGERLPPERRRPREAYAVWLYNSPRSAVRLGFVVPPVGTRGRFVNHRDLPPDAARYRLVVVTLEQGLNALPKGPIVLQGTLPLPADGQGPG